MFQSSMKGEADRHDNEVLGGGDYVAEDETGSEYTSLDDSDYKEDWDQTSMLDPKIFAENHPPPPPNYDDEYKTTWDVDALFWMNDEAVTTADFEDEDGDIDDMETPPSTEYEGIPKIKFPMFRITT